MRKGKTKTCTCYPYKSTSKAANGTLEMPSLFADKTIKDLPK